MLYTNYKNRLKEDFMNRKLSRLAAAGMWALPFHRKLLRFCRACLVAA